MKRTLTKLNVPPGSKRTAYAYELDRQLALIRTSTRPAHRAPRRPVAWREIGLWAAVAVACVGMAVWAGTARYEQESAPSRVSPTQYNVCATP